jgi:hypothetical protein
VTETNAAAFREKLARQDREKIEMNYDRALARGDVDPVVLLFDSSDALARAILDWHDQSERVAAMVAEAARRGGTPVVISGLPRRDALRITQDSFPGLQREFDAKDPGAGYHVVVIAAGGAMVLVMPPLPA